MAERILLAPQALAALLRATDRLTSLLRPTLGPLPRTLAIQRLLGGGPPEILDSGAVIVARSALREGVMPGGGAALLWLHR